MSLIRRRMMMKKSVGGVLYQNGVYIQHIDGTLYKSDEWSAKGYAASDANGVAVISDECSFVIAKNYISAALCGRLQVIPDVLDTPDQSKAIADFDGIGNTQKYINYQGADANNASQRANNFTFPNGNKGYIPAAGEVYVALQNISDIRTAFSLLNATFDQSIISNTQNSQYYVWGLRISSTSSFRYDYAKNSATRVKIFTTLD